MREDIPTAVHHEQKYKSMTVPEVIGKHFENYLVSYMYGGKQCPTVTYTPSQREEGRGPVLCTMKEIIRIVSLFQELCEKLYKHFTFL